MTHSVCCSRRLREDEGLAETLAQHTIFTRHTLVRYILFFCFFYCAQAGKTTGRRSRRASLWVPASTMTSRWTSLWSFRRLSSSCITSGCVSDILSSAARRINRTFMLNIVLEGFTKPANIAKIKMTINNHDNSVSGS